MLTNLLKYEFKTTGRVVLPIASGVLVLNIFTGSARQPAGSTGGLLLY